MAQIVYTDLQGQTVAVKNPTRKDMDAFWEIWWARHGEALQRDIARELAASGSVFWNMGGVVDVYR